MTEKCHDVGVISTEGKFDIIGTPMPMISEHYVDILREALQSLYSLVHLYMRRKITTIGESASIGSLALSLLPTLLHKWLLEGGYKCRVLAFIIFFPFWRAKHD